MRNHALRFAAAFAATITLPSLAAAADATVTTNLNIRAGPSTDFPIVGVIPEDGRIDVHGCVRGYSWCDVTWHDLRGWVSASYLRYYYRERYVPLIEYPPAIDLPIIVFSVDSYWDHHYKHRHWYQRRAHWKDVWRYVRRDQWEDRRDRRDDKAEDRRDRRRELIERRRDRRDDKAEQWQNRREQKAEQRDRRREQKAEQRDRRRKQKVERFERQKKRAVERNRRRDNAARRDRRPNVGARPHRERMGRNIQRSRPQINRRAGPELRGMHGFRAPSRAGRAPRPSKPAMQGGRDRRR